MTGRRRRAWWSMVGPVALAAGLTGTSGAAAQETKPAAETKMAEAPAGPNTGRLALSVGMDWTSAYFFRGIKQETEGTILQPYGELTIKLVDQAGPLTSLSLTAGIWNSLQSGPTGSDSPTAGDPKSWYELDGYGRLSAVLWDDVTTSLIYTAYTSPNNAFGTVQELAVGVAYSDAKLLGALALNPSVLVAFELDGQADAGAHEGIYAQIGIAPGLTVFGESAYPLSVSVPLSVGLSLKDYYEFGRFEDKVFGYFSAGVSLSLPLAFIPPDFGKWVVKGGVQILALGDALKTINDGDEVQVIGSLGPAFAY